MPPVRPMSPHPPRRPITVAYAFLDFADGGAQRLALAWWRSIDRRRVSPLLVCLRGEGALVPRAVEAGVPVHLLGRLKRPWDPLGPRFLAQVLRRARADVVHVPTYSRAAPYAMVAARLARTPVVVAHEHCRPGAPGRARRLADRLLRRGVRYLAVSEADRARLIAGGAAPGAVTVLPNCVGEEFFSGPERAPARRGLGVTPGQRVILVPARLVPRKGHVDFLTALPRILDRVPGTVSLFAGAGPMRGVLASLVDSASLAGSVRLLGHRDDMPALVAAADVVVLPSRLEGQPLALLEAQAGARPVVATAVGGVAEVVSHGETGLLVPPANPGALAEAVAALLGDANRRRRLGRQARLKAEAFRPAPKARRLEELYSRWLAEAAPNSDLVGAHEHPSPRAL